MKRFDLVACICLLTLANIATASPRSERIERDIQDLDRVEKVKDIIVSFPKMTFHSDFSKEGVAKAALDSPELTIQTSRLQTLLDTLSAISASALVKCIRSNPEALGIVRIEFNDKHVDDYYLTISQLVDRRSQQCFANPIWISKAVSFWDRPNSRQ